MHRPASPSEPAPVTSRPGQRCTGAPVITQEADGLLLHLPDSNGAGAGARRIPASEAEPICARIWRWFGSTASRYCSLSVRVAAISAAWVRSSVARRSASASPTCACARAQPPHPRPAAAPAAGRIAAAPITAFGPVKLGAPCSALAKHPQLKAAQPAEAPLRRRALASRAEAPPPVPHGCPGAAPARCASSCGEVRIALPAAPATHRLVCPAIAQARDAHELPELARAR